MAKVAELRVDVERGGGAGGWCQLRGHGTRHFVQTSLKASETRTHESASNRARLGVEQRELKVVDLARDDLLAEALRQRASDRVEQDRVVVAREIERVGEGDLGGVESGRREREDRDLLRFLSRDGRSVGGSRRSRDESRRTGL